MLPVPYCASLCKLVVLALAIFHNQEILSQIYIAGTWETVQKWNGGPLTQYSKMEHICISAARKSLPQPMPHTIGQSDCCRVFTGIQDGGSNKERTQVAADALHWHSGKPSWEIVQCRLKPAALQKVCLMAVPKTIFWKRWLLSKKKKKKKSEHATWHLEDDSGWWAVQASLKMKSKWLVSRIGTQHDKWSVTSNWCTVQ